MRGWGGGGRGGGEREGRMYVCDMQYAIFQKKKPSY